MSNVGVFTCAQTRVFRFIQVNPVLEAFGNAKTQYNNNSSRFGKFISVKFNKEGAIRGAVMTEYLLEKSRVISHTENEQNFHIFYLFFNGMGSDPRFSLGDIGDYRFTCSNQDACRSVGSKHFTEMYKELVEAFNTIGFTADELEDLFKLLSGVLHLGDIEFSGEDESKVSSEAEKLTTVCFVLFMVAFLFVRDCSCVCIRLDTHLSFGITTPCRIK